MTIRSLGPALVLALVLSTACGDGGTGPRPPTVGPIGPLPQGLTGKVAFVLTADVISGGVAYVQSTIHVIDMANPTDQVVYTAGQNVVVQGLTWAPDGQRFLMQTFLSQPLGPNGENRNIWVLRSLNAAGGDERIYFGAAGPESHPQYSAGGRLAYFAGWSNDPTAGIYVDGRSTHPLVWAGSSYLSWSPDGATIVYTGDGAGLQELTLAGGSVTQIIPPESGAGIVEPAFSPDGTRIAMVRFGGSYQGGELWTVSPSGTDPVRLTSGFTDDSPAWTPNGTYLAFLRGAGSAPGVYVMPAAGGTPVRIVGIAGASIGPMSWTR